MTAPEVELRAVWQRLAGRQHDHHLDGLLRRLAEPHRRYHTAVHVMWVLRHLATAPVELDLPALQLAALYHDAIYDPRAASPANELASADLAAGVATDLGWDAQRVALVHRLVLSTAHLEPTSHADPHEQALIAADLAILGADPADYSAYVVGVRAEYGHVSDTDWRTGRSAVLQHLLTFDTLGSRARANLTAELAQYRQRTQ
jgi:predicted metal-dependent HD superfamily phosphohydrolase